MAASATPSAACPIRMMCSRPRLEPMPRLESMWLPSFYPILDTEVSARYGVDPIRAADEILNAGAQILQVRHKGFLSRETFEQIERIAALCREVRVPFV